MKKLVFVFAAFAAISLASCGGSKKAETVEVEVEEAAACCAEAATDSAAVDTIAVEVVEEVAE